MKKDKDTFLKMLEDHQGIIFKVSNSYCPDPAEREDLVQEIILQLWRSFKRYDERYKLSTWVYRIALNVSISYYRKLAGRKKVIADSDQNFVHIAGERSGDQEDDLKLLHHFIGQLDELNKALVILYLDGYSHEEIAGVLHISTSNVGTKLSRIRQKLKQQVKKYNDYGTGGT